MLMKNFYRNSCLFLATLTLTPLVALADEPIDFGKVNATIEKILSESLAKSEVITNFNYAFDTEETDLSKDLIKLSIEMSLSKSSWAEKELKVESTLTFDANMEIEEGRGVSVSFDNTYSTDALAMLKHAVPKLSNCTTKIDKSGVAGILRTRHCEYVEKLKEINSIDDLKVMLEEKLAAHQADLTDYQSELSASQAKVAFESDSNLSVLISKQLQKAESTLKFIDGVQITGEAGELIIQSPEIKECPILDSKGMNLHATENSLKLHGKVHLKFGKTLYLASKDIISEVLRGLQNDEEFAKKMVELDAQWIRNFVLGQVK